MLYLILKTIHIAAVVIFLGNILTGNFWKAHADRTGNTRVMADMIEGIIRSDQWFTVPGVVITIVTGVALAVIGEFPILGTFWVWSSLVLIAISGICFQYWVAPLQHQMLVVTQDGVRTGILDERKYKRLSRWWAFWGFIALLAPTIALVLMVLKPLSL